jgi:hypothetical protein
MLGVALASTACDSAVTGRGLCIVCVGSEEVVSVG